MNRNYTIKAVKEAAITAIIRRMSAREKMEDKIEKFNSWYVLKLEYL